MARRIEVQLIGDSRQLERTFGQASRSARGFNSDLGKASRGALSAAVSFHGLGRALAFGSAQFLATASIVATLKASSEAASNLAEQTSKTRVVFGEASAAVEDFANNALGQARDEALATASTFGALLRPLGFLPDAAAKTSVELSKLGVDLASFFNTPVADALQAITSGLVGEVEPLRRYGVLLSAARVEQEALTETGKKHAAALTNQEKVQARLALIFRDSKQAAGDYDRTLGGLANQQREFQKNVRNLEISIGAALNPTIKDVTVSLNGWLSNTENQKRVQRDVAEVVRVSVGVIKDLAAVVKTAADAVGGFKHLLEILIALKLGAVLLRWAAAARELRAALIALNTASIAASLGGIGTSAASSAGPLVRLLGYLRRIGRIGVLSIAFRFPGLAEFAPLLSKLAGGAAGLAAFVASLPGDTPKVKGFQNEGSGFTAARLVKEGKIPQSVLIQGAIEAGLDPRTAKVGNLLNDKDAVAFVLRWARDHGLIPNSQSAGGSSAEALAKAAHGLGLTAAASSGATGSGSGGGQNLTAQQRNTFFDNAIARILLRGGLGSIQQQIAALQKANTLIAARLKVTKDVTRRLALEDELLQNAARLQDLNAQQAAAALQKRQDAVGEFIARLQLGVTKAQASGSFAAPIAALKALQAGIKSEIKEFGNTADLAGQLFDVQQQLKQAKLSQVTAKQFRELGLTASGDEITPAVANLKKRLAQLSANLVGSTLDTPKLEAQLARFRKVLSEGLVPKDVRAKIRDMLDGIAEELKNHSGKLTKFTHVSTARLLAGIGLSPDEIRALRPRLAQIGVNGTAPGRASQSFALAGATGGELTVHTQIDLDGQKVAVNTTKHQQQRRSSSRRG